MEILSNSKKTLENKSYYGGIYSYFRQQKLKAKESNQIKSKKEN
jgi:hypothetical protein